MHPILGNLRRLIFYLLAWIPLAAIISGLLVYSGKLPWQRAVTMAAPLCLIYAFACLGAWYICKATPVETSGFSRLIVTHIFSAIVISGVWVLLGRGLASALSDSATFSGLDQQFSGDYPLLFSS